MLFEKKMSCQYNSYKDLYDRLQGTFIRYAGKPVYVAEIIKNPPRLILQDLGSEDILAKVSPDDSDLDISAFEVGYVNSSNGVVSFLSRSASKHYKQGTYPDHLISRNIENSDHTVSTSWVGEAFYDMLLGVYPSKVEAAESLITKKRKEVALSRDVALQRLPSDVILVYYKTFNLGWMTPDLGSTYVTDSEISWIVKKKLQEHELYPRRF